MKRQRGKQEEASGDEDRERKGRGHNHDKGKKARREQRRRPIQCKDGFMMTVSASRGHLCSPRDDYGPYSAVEVTYPNELEDLLLAYTDTRTPVICGYAPTRYANVPAQVV